ncbi:MAG: glycogen/starch synthase [Chloroflexota bacterium]
MNVLFASAETAPFAKAGGLGDVVGSLPQALRKQGIDARVLMPMYGFIDRAAHNIAPAFNFQFSKRNSTADVYISQTEHDGVPIYFLTSWPFFGEGGYLYTDWKWDLTRFTFLGQAIMATVAQMQAGVGNLAPWSPDVIHVHDWHTALVPFLLNERRRTAAWAKTSSVLTIHNMAYQGDNAGGFLWDAGIPGRHQPDLVYQDKADNMLGIGIAYSSMITTVSPRYAQEIQYPRFGEGLEGLLGVRSTAGDVRGILNGIDVDRWNPATDSWLPHNYTAENVVEVRKENKAALQREAGLAVRPEVPLIGMVSRLVDQKGVDLAIPALRRLLLDTDVQFIVLGSGDKTLENDLWKLCDDFRWKARAYLQFDAILSQHIYGACDLFLMPSRYEPCGIGQMMAMRYGALPIVRETGGLADTVQNYDNGNADFGTGFVFVWEEWEAVLNTLRWAIDTYKFRPDAFLRMQQRAMQIDFSWDKSAREYIDVYEAAQAKPLPARPIKRKRRRPIVR